MPDRVHPTAFVKGRSYSSIKQICDVFAHMYLGTFVGSKTIGNTLLLNFKHEKGVEFHFVWDGTEEFYEGAGE